MAAKGHQCSSSGNGTKCLSECPTNVKEAIDWVLCLTGNDGCQCQKPQLKDGATACVEKVAKDVLDIVIEAAGSGDTSLKWAWNEIDMTTDSGLSDKDGKPATYIKGLIDELGKKLASFIGCINCMKTPCPQCTSGKCTRGLAKGGYTYCYSSASECCIKSNKTDQKKVCAKILLGCIPLIFSSLTYLYWKCCNNPNGKNWNDCNVKPGSTDSLCTYLITLGYDISQLNDCKGSEVKGFLCSFKELSDCFPSKTSGDKPKSYAKFIYDIQIAFTSNDQEEDTQKKQEKGKNMPLQRLYMGASSYFQASQDKDNEKVDKAKRPESICELLYWLLGLPYTPVGMQVERSSLGVMLGKEDEENAEAKGCGYLPSDKCCKSQPASSECPMTPENADPYLLPPCYYSAFVLLSIEGKFVSGANTTAQQAASTGESGGQQHSSGGGSNSKESGPFLHDVYSNKHFRFYYPSSIRSWAVMVWDAVYALYFQLGFLYKQCHVNYKDGYGWKDCKYGNAVTCYKSQTWICTPSKPLGDHNDQCGKSSNNCSPLQGYLCDALTDFRCKNKDEESDSKSEPKSKSYCTHLDHRPSSQWCPIPMGFADNLRNLTPERKGEHLYEILSCYFKENTEGSSLYQLVLLLGIVSLRPPRCLGDMFAFFCGIGRLCDTTNPPKNESLEKLWKAKVNEYPGTPDPEKIKNSLKALAGKCDHPASPDHTCDSLCSLSPPSGSACGSCTKYICSLSWSVYAVFARGFHESYLSWVLYLTDNFQTNLEIFLKALEDVECNHGCSACTKNPKCHKNDDTNGCKCKVVECKDILGALYSFGFTYQDASSLKTDNKKCSEFLKQLKAVVEGSPLKELIKAVNQILYSIRLAFIFWAWLLWTVAIVYLIFGLVVDLDILHIRSHIWLKHTHNIPAFNLFAARRLKYGIQVYFGR